MKLYLVNAEDIYFPQIKVYFREIISSYDNGNYRSAIVMLYSTIVCDLFLKIKEISDVYSDEKTERLLQEINKERQQAKNSDWEWSLIKKIRQQTELLNDETYNVVQHIYDLRNFSAHPAMNEDYELISPTPEMTVAYIKKALEDIFVKPSVFAQNIVDRMSDDIAMRREQYVGDIEAFKLYLNKVYFQRMSDKMMNQVFKAFWKFAFIKTDGDVYNKNRIINRMTLDAILCERYEVVCKFVEEHPVYFTAASEPKCLVQLCVLLAFYPHVYGKLDETTKYQITGCSDGAAPLFKWFISGKLEEYLLGVRRSKDGISKEVLEALRLVCEKQGQPRVFYKFLIDHYSKSCSFASARARFDEVIENYLDDFNAEEFIKMIEVINSNRQIYGYGWQDERNDKILQYARPLLSEDFDFDQFEHFKYTKKEEEVIEESLTASGVDGGDGELPF